VGTEVVLQDERGSEESEMIHDPDGAIVLCLPDPADASYSCVRFIDPYGDTIFNRLQAAAMISEWDRLRYAFLQNNAGALWADVRALIVRCSEEPHLYLRFVGD
jgi:hypothetical protein